MPILARKPTRNSSDTPEELRATLGQHLEELRVRLFRIVAILAGGIAIAWWYEPYFYDQLNNLAAQGIPEGVKYKEAFRSITEAFFLKLKLSLYISLVGTLPLTVMQLWGFIAPGLRPNERRPLKIVVPISTLLFLFGAWLAWFITPITIGWFVDFVKEFPGVEVIQEPAFLIFFIVKMMIAFGIGFQLPLVVFFLTKVGIITPDALMRYWRQSTLGVFVAAAIITPSGDPFTMLLMAVPLTTLFFASVIAAKITSRKSARSDELNDLD